MSSGSPETITSDLQPVGTTTALERRGEGNGVNANVNVNDGPVQVPTGSTAVHAEDAEGDEEEEPQMNMYATLVSHTTPFPTTCLSSDRPSTRHRPSRRHC